VSHPQECSAAVSYAKSFNSKAIFMSRTDHSDRHKGCFIYDSGAVWFNTHDTGSRSSYVTSICKTGCPNSDGLTGFYHTHDGYWTKDHTLQGSKTKMECANTCTQNCVAFNTYATEEQEQEGEEEEEDDDDDDEEGAKEGEQKEKEATSSKGDCYHYSNRSSLITANERQWAVSKAYIKCLVLTNDTETTSISSDSTTDPIDPISIDPNAVTSPTSPSDIPTTPTPGTTTEQVDGSGDGSGEGSGDGSGAVDGSGDGSGEGSGDESGEGSGSATSTAPPTTTTTTTTTEPARFSYYVNDQPKNGCAPGLGVSDKDECKEACENLAITVPNGNWQNDGKPCLAISKSTCKQSNSLGNKAYRICKQEV